MVRTMPAEEMTSDDRRCEKPFLEHLDDLRTTILWSGGFLLAGILVAIPLVRLILEALKGPLQRAGYDADALVRVITVGGGFFVAMRVVFWSGLLLALPGILWSVAGFVYPGLTARERRTVTLCFAAAGGLFITGALLAYFTTVPMAIKWLIGVDRRLGFEPELIELGNFAAFVIKLMICFGLTFELPVILLALGNMGLVNSTTLRGKRRHVVVCLMAVAMFLTPQDPLSMVLMGLPLIGLYEASIWIIWYKERRVRRHDSG